MCVKEVCEGEGGCVCVGVCVGVSTLIITQPPLMWPSDSTELLCARIETGTPLEEKQGSRILTISTRSDCRQLCASVLFLFFVL